MKITIVTIGTAPHASWGVTSETVKVSGSDKLYHFLESDDKKVLQKIRLGGNPKDYPNDTDFTQESATVGDVVTTGDISIQNIEIPFGRVIVNSKNLNPCLVGYDTDCEDDLAIVLLGNEYSYIRSNINHSVGEIICTFHTPTVIACVIRLSRVDIANETDVSNTSPLSLLMLDTSRDSIFYHFRLVADAGELKVINSIVKKDTLISRLKNINEKFRTTNVKRRFVRHTTQFITASFICPSSISQKDIQDLIIDHGISDALDGVPVSIYPVNVDENGVIVKDEKFDFVIDTMKTQKVKAFTLIGCKTGKDYFAELKPLYIFGVDVVDSEDISIVKCIKSN